MTTTKTKITPCLRDLSENHITATCPDCGHSAFTHQIEPDGCIICHVDSTRDDINEMLEEMRGIMEWFSQAVKPATPRATTGSGKLRRKRSRNEP